MTWLASIPSQIDANGSACAWAAACSPLRPALLGIWRQHLYDILNERKPVSPTVAFGLVSCSAMVPESGRECRAHMILAERDLSDEIKRIPAIKTKVA